MGAVESASDGAMSAKEKELMVLKMDKVMVVIGLLTTAAGLYTAYLQYKKFQLQEEAILKGS